MTTTLTLIDLAGAIALLIWGVHMVQTGVNRAFGPHLRRALSYALGNRLKAFAAGLGVTAILQSSTATGLMVTSFRGGWAGRSCPGTRHHARRKCRDDADSPGAILQRVQRLLSVRVAWRPNVSPKLGNSNARSRAGGH